MFTIGDKVTVNHERGVWTIEAINAERQRAYVKQVTASGTSTGWQKFADLTIAEAAA